MNQFIDLPNGGPGAGFYVYELVAHLRNSRQEYIIQGQQNCALFEHTKPQSLDVWLRNGYAAHKDRKQAVNEVVDALVDTGLFEIAYLPCPDSGRWCKALMLVNET
jgi:hypothetical protein